MGRRVWLAMLAVGSLAWLAGCGSGSSSPPRRAGTEDHPGDLAYRTHQLLGWPEEDGRRALEKVTGPEANYFWRSLFGDQSCRFPCKLCGRGLETESELEQHMYAVHRAGYTCKDCLNVQDRLVVFQTGPKLDEHRKEVHEPLWIIPTGWESVGLWVLGIGIVGVLIAASAI